MIQHGELDRRVPIANAYQLLQGLRDKGVKTELIFIKASATASPNPKSAWQPTGTTGSGL